MSWKTGAQVSLSLREKNSKSISLDKNTLRKLVQNQFGPEVSVDLAFKETLHQQLKKLNKEIKDGIKTDKVGQVHSLSISKTVYAYQRVHDTKGKKTFLPCII